MKNHFTRRLVAIALVLLLNGCSWFYGTRPMIRVHLSAEPQTLDPVAAIDPASQWVLSQIQRGLTQVGADGSPTGDLCEGWSIDASGRRYTFVLSPVKWSDGVELKSSDFLFSWQRHLQTPTSPARAVLASIEGAEGRLAGSPPKGLRALSDRVLEVTLTKADKEFPKKLATALLGPQREEVFAKHPAEHSSPLHLRAIGVYQPTHWTPGQSLKLAVNSYSPITPSIALIELVFSTPRASSSGPIDASVDLESGLVKMENPHLFAVPRAQRKNQLGDLYLK